MTYHYSKYKFSSQLFYKTIQLAKVEHTSGLFQISIIPFFNYGGKYHIHSVSQKDNKRTLFLTMKSQDVEPDFDFLNPHNKFFISLSHDGRKTMVFDSNLNGIILKS